MTIENIIKTEVKKKLYLNPNTNLQAYIYKLKQIATVFMIILYL